MPHTESHADAAPRPKASSFLVLGRAGMDFYADPPGTEIEAARNFVAHLGGSAANIAVALAKLGARAGLVSCLSDDAVGRFCAAELVRYGVDTRHTAFVGGGGRTSLAVVETRLNDCEAVIYRNNAADLALTPAAVSSIDPSSYGALIVTGTALAASPSREATLLAIAAARTAGTLTVLDIDYRPSAWASEDEARTVKLEAARACGIVIGNEEEFGLLAGGMADGLALAHELVSQGAFLAIYKMGPKGAIAISRHGSFTAGIYRSNALKPTGAGDAFMGGFMSGLGSGLDLRAAVLRGAAAAAITVSRVGCAPAFPTAQELAAFLATTPEPSLS